MTQRVLISISISNNILVKFCLFYMIFIEDKVKWALFFLFFNVKVIITEN